jgi:outer membrane protein TolC
MRLILVMSNCITVKPGALSVNLLTALLVGTLGVLPSGAAPTLADTFRVDLEAAIVRAIEVSPEILQSASSVDRAAARSRFAKTSRFLTEFNATTTHSVVPGVTNPNDVPTDQLFLDPDVRNDWDKLAVFNQLQIELLQPIYTWGEIGGLVQAAEHGVDVEEAGLDTKKDEVTLRTADLYYTLLLGEALVRFAEEAVQIVDTARVEAQRLLDEGYDDIYDADLFRVLIAEQEIKARLVQVREGRDKARAALVRQLVLPEGTVIDAEDLILEPMPFTLGGLDEYLALALEHRPELAQVSAGVQARDALVRVARSDYFPKLFIGGQYGVRGARNRYSQANPYHGDPALGGTLNAALGLRLNLNYLQTKANVERARALREETRYQLEAAQQLVLFEVEEAYRDVVIAQEAMRAQNEAARISREWLLTERISFDLEIVRVENLLEAVARNIELKARGFEATFGFNKSVLRLLWTTGTLADRARAGTLVE